MKPEQEPKYVAVTVAMDGRGNPIPSQGQQECRLANRASGELIPDDEPVFILRARDVHAVALLGAYADLIVNGQPEHRALVAKRIEQFWKFRSDHPERMKEPDSP